MIAELEKIEFPGTTGFMASYLDDKGGIWQFHHEFELMLNLKSYGTRIIGDSVELFDRYDMTLIAGNIPHSWNHYLHEGGVPPGHGIVLHFSRASLGEGFIAQHEMNSLRELLEIASLGIAFSETDARKAEPFLDIMTRTSGMEKMAAFFSLMHILCSSGKKRQLCSENYKPAADNRGNPVISRVYEYIRQNYSKPLTINDLASVAEMKPGSFGKYFKRNCGTGVVEYVNQVRSNRACYLLRETDRHVYEIAIECGFQSISNFNKLFRKHNMVTPVEYRGRFR
ncbi:MAG: helix-turn-helix transcriptional regulator [Bacteroidetes bacterium]|nr:helix-turn-helix transcriptional regulator [Bacteroidota bacterium]